MNLFKQIIAMIGIFSVSLIMGCGKEPLLTNMGTNQLVLVLKGTYESNSPRDWAMPKPCDHFDPAGKCDTYTVEHRTLVQDDSVTDCDGSDAGTPYGKDDLNPNIFMIDLSEIKLIDYKSTMFKFANYRQTYAFGLGDKDPFFSGLGYILENDDAPSKTYAAVLFYVRKMLMDGAKRYTPSSNGWYSQPVWDVFSENELPCFNFNKNQMHSFYDTLRYEGMYLNRVYPLIIPISDFKGMVFSNKFPVTVLEIRIVVKNYIKKYQQVGVGEGVNSVVHYYALSDWLQDVQPGDKVIGGNIVTVARSYIPGVVGRIQGSVPSGLTPGRHVIAIPSGASINEYTIPLNLRSSNPCNLPTTPPITLGFSLSQMMEYFLKMEKFKYDWNQKVPTPCGSIEDYQLGWDAYAYELGIQSFKVPELAVFAKIDAAATPPFTGKFSIENVMPGAYDLYMANVAPTYGQLYNDGQFTAYPNNPVTVSPGSSMDSAGNTSIVFP
jgi:hypothetical protein